MHIERHWGWLDPAEEMEVSNNSLSSRRAVCGTQGSVDNAAPAGIRYQEKETGYNRYERHTPVP